MSSQDAGDPSANQSHDDDEGEYLSALGEFDRRGGLPSLVLDAMCRLALGQSEHPISKPWMDLLVFGELIGRRIGRTAEAEALPDYLAAKGAGLECRIGAKVLLWSLGGTPPG